MGSRATNFYEAKLEARIAELEDAARDVVLFDWSDTDAGAADSIDRLRDVLGPVTGDSPLRVAPRDGACVTVGPDGVTFSHWEIENTSGDRTQIGLAILEWLRQRVLGCPLVAGGSYFSGPLIIESKISGS